MSTTERSGPSHPTAAPSTERHPRVTVTRSPPARCSSTFAAFTLRTGSSNVTTTGPRNPPATSTLPVGLVMSVTNVARTDRLPRIAIVHVSSVPEQAPSQPVK